MRAKFTVTAIHTIKGGITRAILTQEYESVGTSTIIGARTQQAQETRVTLNTSPAGRIELDVDTPEGVAYFQLGSQHAVEFTNQNPPVTAQQAQQLADRQNADQAEANANDLRTPRYDDQRGPRTDRQTGEDGGRREPSLPPRKP